MAKPKRGLGKGLNALIPQSYEETIKEDQKIENNTNMIDINKIIPNKNQPRKFFDKDKISNLEESIKIHGVVQPIIVRKTSEGYEIVAGERRWRAAKNAELKEIPCIVKDLSEDKLVEISLIENLQREDLNDIEEALAYKGLVEEYGMTQERISKIIGKSRPYIANILRLLNLNKEIQQMITDGKISGGHGRALLRVDDNNLQREVAERIIKEELTVRESEKLITIISNKKKKQKEKKENRDSNLIFLEDSLKEVFGTKVSIIAGKKKGKIEIEYYNENDLERIINILKD